MMNEANEKRQIVFDTETTGMNFDGLPHEGHRVIEIGCVELINRKLTGRHYHVYLNPERAIDAKAIEVHGITDERVANEPLFSAIQADFLAFIRGAELIAHNAMFDVGFINQELQLSGATQRLEDDCSITDTLAMAKKTFPGQKNNLDALCKRYGIDNAHRTLHGALLDAEILADVYLRLSGGQAELNWIANDKQQDATQSMQLKLAAEQLLVLAATSDEAAAHQQKLTQLQASGACIWLEPQEV
jgi:DNA polymerase-3 subunit epsilon